MTDAKGMILIHNFELFVNKIYKNVLYREIMKLFIVLCYVSRQVAYNLLINGGVS